MHTLSTGPTPAFSPADALRVLEHPLRLRLLNYLRLNGPTSLDELSRDLELRELRLRYLLSEVRALGLVRLRSANEGTVAYYSAIGWARLRRKLELGLREITPVLGVAK